MTCEMTPKIVQSHTTRELKIEVAGDPLSQTEEYFAAVVPSYDFWIIQRSEPRYCTPIPCRCEENTLYFTYPFGTEQEYGIKIYRGDWSHQILATSIFAVDEDLFAYRPILSDFHIHTTYSDGKESPAEVCAAYCQKGFQAIAITDHYTMEGSRAARAAFEGLPLPMQIYYGEEIQACQKNHLIHFGVNQSINDWFKHDADGTCRAVHLASEKIDVPADVDRLEAAALEFLSSKLKETGGVSIFAHPFWRSNAYHLNPAVASFALRNHLFDAFELLGGHGVHENSMQLALWHDLTAEGVKLTVLGCSDSHTVRNEELFNNMKSVVFAKNNSFEQVRDAILHQRTAAVCRYPGEETRVFGTLRLTAYTGYLMTYYFPGLIERMKRCGDLMLEHAQTPVAAEVFSKATEEVNAYIEAAFAEEPDCAD